MPRSPASARKARSARSTGRWRPGGTAAGVLDHLRTLADPERAAAHQWFFKTGPGEYGAGDRFLGIRVPVVRSAARAYRSLPLREVTRLLRSPWHEARLLALCVLVRRYQRGTPHERDAIYRLYLRQTTRINNWDLVDCSAGHIVGAHLHRGDRRVLRRLARSSRLWERRIAIMATSHYIRHGEFDETLRIARVLLHDPHDLIHKAVGWLLREIGNRDRRTEEAFLREHAAEMPRTMLRYAIEKFPVRQRRRYLRRRA